MHRRRYRPHWTIGTPHPPRREQASRLERAHLGKIEPLHRPASQRLPTAKEDVYPLWATAEAERYEVMRNLIVTEFVTLDRGEQRRCPAWKLG